MGIYIYLSISKSVTKDEWASVYKETFSLVRAFSLAERRIVSIRGIKTVCFAPTEERQHTYGWYNEKIETGWFADGDYESLCEAERYFLPRDLVTDEDYDPDAPDAMYCELSNYLNYEWDDPRVNNHYSLWGMKTQGEPYHMYLLAIACLIEFRLGQKAHVYGDITRGQCRKAVEMANQYLEKKIDLPVRCDAKRLLERIKSFSISEAEMLTFYIGMFLGTKDVAFGSTLRNNFSETTTNEYWKKHFGRYQVTKSDLKFYLKDYLLWGFDLEKLSDYISFTDEEGKDHYDDFVESIMATKFYIKEKSSRETLIIDPEELYEISSLFAHIFCVEADDKEVDCYIPLESIREALVSSIGDKCDVNRLIDQYLEKDEEYQKPENGNYDKKVVDDPFEEFAQEIRTEKKRFAEAREMYAISDFEHLLYYKTGDSIWPIITKRVGKFFTFYRSFLEEEKYAELINDTPESRCEWLASENRDVLLRDKDWDKIFGDITDNPASFSRYYPMVRIILTDRNLICLLRAIVINDDFYQYAFELERKYNEEKKDASN